jgi:DHA1 family bicyclomycin/chloramphenicol resistance-like MFS transporter
VASDYSTLLRSPQFIGFAIGGGCATTSVYAFIATAPFIFAGELHRPLHEVGFYLGLLVSGMTVGNALTARLVTQIRIERLMLGGNLLSIVGAAGLLATIILGDMGVANTLAWMFLFTCGAGMTSPAALTKAVSVNPPLTGSASGLYGCTQMTIGAICTSLVAFGQHPALSAAIILLAAALIAQITFRMALRKKVGLLVV